MPQQDFIQESSMAKMPIITLTTDFGTQDYYAGALKGALLRHCPGAQLIDISHSITAFDIVQAAFVLQNAYPDFPEGSIHLLGVNCVYDLSFRFVAVQSNGHYFLAPDNGILTLLFDQLPEPNVRVLPIPEQTDFQVKHVFAAAAQHLVAGHPFEALGAPAGPLLKRINLQAVITPTRIRGTIIHIDNFENAIVNIRRETFEKAVQGGSFSLFFKRNDPITKLSESYADVPIGEPLCRFNNAGYLEIAVYMGKAATLLGLKVEEVVELVFGD